MKNFTLRVFRPILKQMQRLAMADAKWRPSAPRVLCSEQECPVMGDLRRSEANRICLLTDVRIFLFGGLAAGIVLLSLAGGKKQ